MEANKVRPVQAKDTVMSRDNIDRIIFRSPYRWQISHVPTALEIAEAQAEISFKAGEDKGTCKVVEWVKWNIQPSSFTEVGNWEAQLKEWNVGA